MNITVMLFRFNPLRHRLVPQNSRTSLVRHLDMDPSVDMPSGVWRLLGLACTLLALFLVS